MRQEKLSKDFQVCGIYMITNPLGKSYIGASVDVRTRLLCHKREAGRTSKLSKSIAEYGFYNHKFEILQICNREDLFFIESELIIKHNAEFIGLNGEYTVTRKEQPKVLTISYYKKDIDAHGSKENLRKAIIAVRDLNKEALTEILKK